MARYFREPFLENPPMNSESEEVTYVTKSLHVEISLVMSALGYDRDKLSDSDDPY